MRALIAVLLALVSTPALAAGDLFDRLISGGSEASEALSAVRSAPGSADARTLFAAAVAAHVAKLMEDAGFFFYLAQLRGKADLEAFPPVGVGGDSPGVLLGALHNQIGAAVNPALARYRIGYQEIVRRIEATQPDYSASYSPGWEFRNRVSEAEAITLFKNQRSELLSFLRSMHTLLSDDQAYEAVMVMQDCNLSTEQASDCEEKLTTAGAALRSAEERLGLVGFLSGP